MTQSGDCSDAAPGSGVLRLPETGVLGFLLRSPKQRDPADTDFRLPASATVRRCASAVLSTVPVLCYRSLRKGIGHSRYSSPIRPNPSCLGVPTGLPRSPLGSCREGKAVGLCWLVADTALCPKQEHQSWPEPLRHVIHSAGVLIHGQWREGLGIQTENVCSDLPRRTTEGYWSISNQFK